MDCMNHHVVCFALSNIQVLGEVLYLVVNCIVDIWREIQTSNMVES
jgi:hypothetical protein